MEILKLQNNHTSLGIHYFNAETLPFDSRVGTWVVALIKGPLMAHFFCSPSSIRHIYIFKCVWY